MQLFRYPIVLLALNLSNKLDFGTLALMLLAKIFILLSKLFGKLEAESLLFISFHLSTKLIFRQAMDTFQILALDFGKHNAMQEVWQM